MAFVIVGFFAPTINSLEPNKETILIEGISERIDYIRSKNYKLKLIPRFVTDKHDTGKPVQIYIQKTDILTTLGKNKKKKTDFNLYQSTPFYNSRPILVTNQKLKDLCPIKKLIIHYQNTVDIVGVLLSAENKLHDIHTISIKNNEEMVDYELIESFLINHRFALIDSDAFLTFENKNPTIKPIIIKHLDDLNLTEIKDPNAIVALNTNTFNYYVPFNKFAPCQENTLYHSGNPGDRLKDLIIFGTAKTMVSFAVKMKENKIIFLENLKQFGFLLVSFNKK